MNARRALAATAVTAVLVPVVLAAAPAAPASGGEGGDGTPAPTGTASASPLASATASPLATPSATQSASQSPSPSQSAAPGDASPTATPSGPASGTASGTALPTTGPSATLTPSPGDSPAPDASSSPTDVTATPSVLLPGSPSASPGGSTDQDSPNGVCDVADFDVRVSGLPARVAAGTTTGPFTVVLDNTAGEDATRVQFGLAVAFREGRRDADWLAAQKYVAVRYYDWGDERWKNASTGGGVYTYADIEAGRRYEMRLRLALAPDTPPGAAGALAFSTRWNFDRAPGSSDCVYDNEWYRFEITASGAAPAVAEVRAQGGSAPLVLRPAARPERTGATRIEGALARTGPGAQLPVAVAASLLAGALGVAALLFAARARRRA